MRPPLRIALIYAQSDENATLSYQRGWPKAFIDSPRFAATPINIASRSTASQADAASKLLRENFEAVVLLHSCYSNSRNLRGPLYWIVARLSPPKVYFIGNEYKGMPEKMRFARNLRVAMMVSQSNDARVLDLYRAELKCKVVGICNTGVDLSLFCSRTPPDQRSIDIGYRSFEAPLYLGNNEKVEIAYAFGAAAEKHGLKADISLDPKDRFDAPGYAAFMNRCRSQIGTESGSDYFELTDATRNAFMKLIETKPQTTWPQIKAAFFDNYGTSVPMRIISGRQVEAAACKNVQFLYEGRYGGYFQSDEHYIAVKKDHSNLDDALRKFKDKAFCEGLVERAFEVVQSELTYERLTERFADELSELL